MVTDGKVTDDKVWLVTDDKVWLRMVKYSYGW